MLRHDFQEFLDLELDLELFLLQQGVVDLQFHVLLLNLMELHLC